MRSKERSPACVGPVCLKSSGRSEIFQEIVKLLCITMQISFMEILSSSRTWCLNDHGSAGPHWLTACLSTMK